MKLTKDQIQHIANLARLQLNDSELEKYAEQMSGILEYVEQLNKVDTSAVAPTAQVTGLENVLRVDEVNEVSAETKSDLIKAAPSSQDNLVKAKSVF
jgi:aspartyl-tRNA(Asn)/glutamyl-tRNA(Gln) amidotransferase subunit C